MKSIIITSLCAVLGLLSGCMSNDAPTSTKQSAAEIRLSQAVIGEHRSAKNKARDVYRHPQKTLAFFGFKPSMHVVEIGPGGGWYTEVLAPAVKGSGKLYAASYVDSGNDSYYSNSRRKFEQKLASNEVYSEVVITDFVPRKPSKLAPDNSADLALTFRNLHNWKQDGVLQMYKDAYAALKPGGIMGVVEHRMPFNQTWDENDKSGYFPERLAIKLALQAGFKLVAKSQINANAKDTADHPRGVWTLPPVLRLGEQDKEKYLAIGESDRMTLKFVKPKKK